MDGKVILVTGATSGIGEATARALAQQGATVVVNGRDRERGELAVRRIQKEANNPRVEFIVGDLSTRSGVRSIAAEFRARHDRLDVLVNNVGAMFAKRQETADGLERTFALNHLSYFHLTNLLLDLLKASAPSRVVNVASNTHRGARLDFDDLQSKRSYSAMGVYNQTKLANVLFTYELARRLAGTGVTVTALHPGVTATSIGKIGGVMSVAWWAMTKFVQGAEQGAQTSIHLASSPDVAGTTGSYYVKQRPVQSSPETYDEVAAKRLWEISEALIG
jgi:NAD(P)-dependent dehydrogenase (short-subunit alcohol dehydrogenase family)